MRPITRVGLLAILVGILSVLVPGGIALAGSDKVSKPSASVQVLCNGEVGKVIVTESNGQSATGDALFYKVKLDGTAQGNENVVAPGQSASVTLNNVSNGDHTVVVTGHNYFSKTFNIKVDCSKPKLPKPSASVGRVQCDCQDGKSVGSVDVTLRNDDTATADAVFHIKVDGKPYGEAVTVKPGNGKVVTITGLTDGDHVIEVSSGDWCDTFKVSVKCEKPAPKPMPSAQVGDVCCVQGKAEIPVHLANDAKATGDATFQIYVDSKPYGGAVTVKPGKNATVQVVGLSKGDHAIKVVSGEQTLVSKTVKVECELQPPPPVNPGITATASACVKKGDSTGFITGTVTNKNAKGKTDYTISTAGASVTLTLDAGATGTYKLSGLKPGDYTVKTAGKDGTSAEAKVTIAQCKEDVPPPPNNPPPAVHQPPANPPALALTGVNTSMWGSLGGLLVLLGFGFMALGRKPRTA